MSQASETVAPETDRKQVYAALLAISFLSVLFQTSMTQELTASITKLRAGFHIVFGLVHAFYGFGMYLAARQHRNGFNANRLRWTTAACGLAIWACLFAVLNVNVHQSTVGTPPVLVLTIVVMGGVLTLLGMIYSGLLVSVHQQARSQIGIAVAWGLAGLVLAFAIRSVLVVTLGNNLILVLVGLCCLVAVLPSPNVMLRSGFILVVAVLGSVFGLDARIEQVRDIENRFSYYFYKEYLTPAETKSFEPLFNGWSPYAKLNFYSVPGTGKIAGVYNYYVTWVFTPEVDARRKLLFHFIEPDDRVLMIAVGGGWPLMSVPEHARDDMVAVELDSVVVNWFRTHPERNNNLYQDIEVMESEGRAALDALYAKGERFDAVLIDLPGSPATQKENPIEFENYLLTTEAVQRARSLLTDDGVLVAYLLPHQTGQGFISAQQAGLHPRALHLQGPRSGVSSDGGHLSQANAVFGAHNQDRVDEVVDTVIKQSFIEREKVSELKPGRDDVIGGLVTTDDQPYARFRMFLTGQAAREMIGDTFQDIISLFKWSLLITAGVALSIAAFSARLGQAGRVGFFFAIGIGQVMLQLTLYARFRSFFGDPMTTTLMVTLILFTAEGLGSLFANRLNQHRFAGGWVAALGMLALIGATHLGINLLPHGHPSMLIRALAAILVVAPAGFITGMFFPIGLLRVEDKTLGRALAMDGAGTFVGFVLFYFVCWYTRISANIVPVAICYAAAALLMARMRSKG